MVKKGIKLGVVLLCLILFSCGIKTKPDLIKEFSVDFFNGFKEAHDTLVLKSATAQVLKNGIVFPSADEGANPSNYFYVSLDFKLNSLESRDLYYKIYYQNESYKHKETLEDGLYNPESAENFYGSWEDVSVGFKKLTIQGDDTLVSVKDSIRILGNPRNELKYYGRRVHSIPNDEEIQNSIKRIKNNSEWYAHIKSKAKENRISVDEQIYLDAQWEIDFNANTVDQNIIKGDSIIDNIEQQILNNNEWKKAIEIKAMQSGVTMGQQLYQDAKWTYSEQVKLSDYDNKRFKRNPRLGNYHFMVVILTKSEYEQLPLSVIDISKKDILYNTYLNPFFYFNKKEIKEKGESIFVYHSKQIVKTSITLEGNKGIFVNPLNIRTPKYSKAKYSEKFGDNENLFHTALYEQYFHVINTDYQLKNIPIAADVVGENYTQEMYKANKLKYPLENRRISHTEITDTPGKTVFYNDSLNAIQLVVPGNKNNRSKENVGIMTRVGTSYGKYTAKIKFPDIINAENVWNGLTCAFWLFSQNSNSWNERNLCIPDGYMPKGSKDDTGIRSKKSTYSEIDIEIVKTSKHWPKSSYGGREDYPIGYPEKDHNLIITTTNWDMACQEPKDYNRGIKTVNYDHKNFELHRWDSWYQALTCKYEYEHDKTVGKDIYYQIEWKPNEIIWRIGVDKNKLDVIGYMSSDNTKIPNNQMVAIVTQEFHYASWWHLAPFDQNNVPYPGKNINGYVYSIEVE